MRSGYNEPASRSSAKPRYRSDTRRNRWPPSPSVEDATASLAREVPSSAGSVDEDNSGEAKSRGSVDQYPIIEEIEPPHNDERRFVLVSDPGDRDGPRHAARDRRRKSFAERGNMAPLNTDIDDAPLLPERTPTPYAYTKPQKESLAPSSNEYFLSPEAITPSSSTVPRTVPNRDSLDARDQNARSTKQIPVRSRHESVYPPPSPSKGREDVFEDSDVESDTSHLRTERRPARYSFVKSDLQKEDLRANVLETQAKSERRKRDSSPPSSARRDAYAAGGSGSTSSSGSSKQPTPSSDSPRSSSSSVNKEPRKSKPAPLETGYTRSSKHSASRPSSPRINDDRSPPRSPRLPPRRPPSPNTDRPSSRSGRPPSPLPSYTHVQQSPRVPITEADWHATYPPTTDRSRPIPRHERYETMPVPMPSINVKSPSPARPPKAENPLPYPVDDRPVEAFMPPEQQYQYDHPYSPVASSPRATRLDSQIPGSPRERSSAFRPQVSSRQNSNPDEIPRSPRVRSNSIRSQTSNDGGRRERKTTVPLSLDRPLPSCPRTEPSSKYNDWYTLQNYPTFDLCPSCYEGVFADTPFSVYFSQTRQYERPIERYCDFSSPWMRLAWLLTIKQRRQSLDLLYNLASITELERQCPGDRELGTDHIAWFGISDPRDGIHVANFAICPCDLKMVETLFPSMIGYFTRLPASSPYAIPTPYTCSLRIKSRRFPKYLDLLVELDAEAQLLGQHPNIHRFVQLARENAYKNECARDKQLLRKPWHFITSLPEFTVCQECFDELIWPGITSTSGHPPSTIPNLFNRTIQPVPGEDPEVGSSCCLYSPRMRKVWERSVQEEDFGYLKRKVLERKRAEMKISRERRDILAWMDGLQRGTAGWEMAKVELKENQEEWKKWE
ncbi:hypothetical protein N0V90_005455 [Kalmusia sp. IMI 367209]|nr:hypothetical protein N0V90_005455 [Kalmusia sp. IMI 367209]